MSRCRKGSPNLLDRIAAAFGIERDQHAWEYFQMQYEHTIFYCRDCECDAYEIRLRNGVWRDVDAPWTFDWEQEWLDKAEIVKEAG